MKEKIKEKEAKEESQQKEEKMLPNPPWKTQSSCCKYIIRNYASYKQRRNVQKEEKKNPHVRQSKNQEVKLTN